MLSLDLYKSYVNDLVCNVFCGSYEDVGYLDYFVKMSLGKESVDPIGAPDVVRGHVHCVHGKASK